MLLLIQLHSGAESKTFGNKSVQKEWLVRFTLNLTCIVNFFVDSAKCNETSQSSSFFLGHQKCVWYGVALMEYNIRSVVKLWSFLIACQSQKLLTVQIRNNYNVSFQSQ